MFRRRILTAVGVALVSVSILTYAAWVGRASAAQTAAVGAGNALKVSPVRIDLKMDPGTSQTIEISIQNLTSVAAILHPVVNDFVASGDESGRPNVILGENEYAPSHSLKRLVKSVPDFRIEANETKNLKFTISAPGDAAGGGYYGAVRFAPADAAGSKNVNLAASVGTLVLLKVNGTTKEELTIQSFDVRKKNGKPSIFFIDKKDLKAVVRFKNSGNIQTEPFGSIVLKRFGKAAGQYEINTKAPRGSVLPDSIRRFDVSLTKVGWFGKYTLSGNFGYGENGQLLSAETTFYVIPLFMLIVGVGLVALLLFLILGLPKLIRSYNRRIISRAYRRRR